MSTPAVTRDRLHRLIDLVPPSSWDDVERFLLDHADPVLRALQDAPFDDESESPGERAAVDAAYDDIANGRVAFHADAIRRLNERA
jgi:hypothetical protein